MKTVFILFIVCSSLTGFAQAVVRDHNTRRQIQRLTHQRWEKFRPRWYFALFHNRYRNGEDRRVMRQLTPTLLSLQENENQSNKENEELGELTKMELAGGASRTIPLTFQVHFKETLQEYQYAFTKRIQQASAKGVPEKYLARLLQEGLSLHQEQELLLNGYLSPGELGEALQRLTHQWKTLLTQLKRLSSYYQLPELPY